MTYGVGLCHALCVCWQAKTGVLHRPAQTEDRPQHLGSRPCAPTGVRGESPGVPGKGRDDQGECWLGVCQYVYVPDPTSALVLEI